MQKAQLCNKGSKISVERKVVTNVGLKVTRWKTEKLNTDINQKSRKQER